jgi:hypothetical protein
MMMRTARSLDTLAADARAFAHTFTADPPTALALDRRASEPRVGRLATTPRAHVTGNLRVREHRRLTEAVTAQTEHDWATAAPAVRAVLSCWEHTGEPTAITDYSGYDTGVHRDAVAVLTDAWSSYRGRMTPIDDTSVGVLGPTALTALDRRLLGAADQQEIALFTDEPTPVPTLRVYPSMTAIVEAVLRVIEQTEPEAVGVVLASATPYRPLLESALRSVGIPFAGASASIADGPTRTFIRLCELAFVDGALPARWLQPVATAVGEPLPAGLSAWEIDAVEHHSDAPAVLETLASLRGMTTAEALDHVGGLLGDALGDCQVAAARTASTDTSLSAAVVARLRRYLRTMGAVTDPTEGGVLLVDAASSMTVDRPVVCHLGLGPGWAATPPRYPWVDADRLLRADRDRFERLLQQGEQRIYMIQHRRGGDPILPCPHFQSIDPRLTTFEAFETVPGRPHPRAAPRRPFRAGDGDAGGYVPRVLSNSSLRKLVVSPQSYALGKVLEFTESEPMVFGSVFHDLAQIRVSQPAVFADRRDALVAAAMQRLAPIVPAARGPAVRTRLEATLTALEAFLDRHPPAASPPADLQDPYFGNELAEELGIDLAAAVTERAFEDRGAGVRGVIDLLCADGAIVDYKTGSQRSPAEVRGAAQLAAIDRLPDYQALLYLDAMRRRGVSMPIHMRFAHLTDAVPTVVRGDPLDIDEHVTEVIAVDEPYPRWARSHDAFARLCDFADSNARVKVLSTLGYERYAAVLTAAPLRSPLLAPDAADATHAALLEAATDAVGSYKYVARGVRLIIDDLCDPAPYIFTDELDAVGQLVEETVDALQAYHTEGFPVWGPRVDTPPDRYVDHRDCMLTGEGF